MVFCKTLKRTVHILVGIVIGFLITSEFRSLNYENFKKDIIFQLCSYQNAGHSISNNARSGETSDVERTLSLINNLINLHDGNRNLLLVGVMTAKQFINSRALTIFQTWAQDLDGHVIFFSSANSQSDQIPLVALPGVDDSYPPQKKSFLMFKFMYDYFGNKYKYFMRADDDVFVNVHKMKNFLQKLNSSNAIFLGQTGVGNKEEFGQLNLNLNENFCMGGPGIIMSHVTLFNLVENAEKCIKKLYSTHEDVEIGRCVKKYAGVSCTWSYDMQNLFYHNSSIQQSIKSNIFPSKELYKAITVHPIKDADSMKTLYLYYQSVEHQELRHRLSKAYRILKRNLNRLKRSDALPRTLDINMAKFPVLLNLTLQQSLEISLDSLYSSRNIDTEITWKFFAQKLYSELSVNPKRHIERHILQAFGTNMQRIMSYFNKQSIRKPRILDYHSIYYGYVKFDSKIGVEYILDLLMIYRKFQGKRMTLPIRRHVYAVQTFSETRLRELSHKGNVDNLIVNVVVPLAGRLSIFQRFVSNFVQVYREDSFMSLSIILFSESSDSTELNLIRRLLETLERDNHVKVNILELNGSFSRGVAFQQSLALFENDSLLFFLDVDMHFTSDVLCRVRRNTLMREQVYFPIVFSQYSNQISNQSWSNEQSLTINESEGYWRQFGFGIVSLYKHDLVVVGGYDVDINGWGMEDVNLYDRFVASSLRVFRAIDPGLIHIYHSIHCASDLSPIQFEMCLGTKLSSLDSTAELSQFINTYDLLRTR